MQKSTWLILSTFLMVMHSNAHSVDSAFQNLARQQCDFWCSVDQTFQQVHETSTELAGANGETSSNPRGGVNMTAIEELITIKINEVLNARQVTTEVATETETYSSCRGVNLSSAKSRNETGGVFDIVIPGVGTKEVYCNTEIDGGGWIVFQRRLDGSVDFYLNWDEYVAGFGDVRGEYWLGLEAIYQLTKNGDVELRIDMIGPSGVHYYAKYSNFEIGPAADNYTLTVNGFSGNATDRLKWHSNQQFTTRNRDNDPLSHLQCARYRKGAWWYNACAQSSLNGVYGKNDHTGIIWSSAGSGIMRFTEMKLRKRM